MGSASVVTKAQIDDVRTLGPAAGEALLQRHANALERFLNDINFPPKRADGGYVGQGNFQIIFDRKLGSGDGENDVATWLYVEWSEQKLGGGDRFVLASGTITTSQDVDVTLGGLAVVSDEKAITFDRAGRVKLDGEKLSKINDLTEDELCSTLASFRPAVVNGATVYSGEMERLK